MKYQFRATRAFWRSFTKLPAKQQRRAREAFLIFKQNPFDSRLGSHKIQKLSARYGRVIYAAEIEANLRVRVLHVLRPFRPVGLPIYVARVPSAPFASKSLRPPRR